MTTTPPPPRHPEHPVDPIFPARWSPRAMTGGHVEESTLKTLLEAARWAPSAFNNQPWRFLYALRGGEYFARYLELLTPSNQAWAKQAGALVVMVSRTDFEHNGKPSVSHSFDTGAAWMAFALQGSLLGLVVHGMQGFDYEAAREVAAVPAGYAVEAMCAVGYPADRSTLPENLREKEWPKGRKSLSEIAFPEKFPPA